MANVSLLIREISLSFGIMYMTFTLNMLKLTYYFDVIEPTTTSLKQFKSISSKVI